MIRTYVFKEEVDAEIPEAIGLALANLAGEIARIERETKFEGEDYSFRSDRKDRAFGRIDVIEEMTQGLVAAAIAAECDAVKDRLLVKSWRADFLTKSGIALVFSHRTKEWSGCVFLRKAVDGTAADIDLIVWSQEESRERIGEEFFGSSEGFDEALAAVKERKDEIISRFASLYQKHLGGTNATP